MSGRVRDEDEEQEDDEEDRASYYGGASIPFMWESRPGTPKHNHFPDCSFSQPLTPPPSYYSAEILSTPKRQTSSQTKVRTKLTRILSMSLFYDLRKSSSKKTATTNHVSSGSSYSWSSTSSSSSLSSSPPHTLRKPVSHGNKSKFKYASYKDHELASSPTSTLCYSNGGRKGFTSSMGSVKRALFSGPRHGPGDLNKA
ncbi:unnamed protein product [Eruca vesicaria subsp. sativa]|uniref:Uncharacterized protein n=1 Tax=Eruca vesicaria subsp. sativa TaxID=29727 RepID=A0ABC8KNS0_ERUVS|nr:unnamed protein product [Eruca vesicaria subsp. sativa]